jgi:RNA polymerase-binding transcription factor
MTNDEKTLIKKSIKEKIGELESELVDLKEAAKPISPDSAYGRLSRMDAINNKSIVDAALVDKSTELQRLQYAITRIELSNFGKCSKCGDDIAVKRLMSIPYVTLCISCASRFR